MKHRGVLAIIAAAAFLSGCASSYTLNGQRYDSAAEFHAASDSQHAQALAAVEPLPRPLTQRRLTVAVPTQQAIREASMRYANLNGLTATPLQLQQFYNLSLQNHKSIRTLAEAAVRRNIYSTAKIVEVDTLMPTLSPAADEDALFVYEAGAGAGGWYLATAAAGRQAFAFDRAQPNPTAMTKAFVDALQVTALRPR